MQKIFFGAPGTGKSYKIDSEILKNVDDANVFRVTFYSDFTYTDFIGQLLPKVIPSQQPGGQNTITYDFSKGVFTQALEKAYMNLSEDVYLVIEEMSRGDSAAIFGDIFQLLDRETKGMNTGYSKYFINNELIAKDIIALSDSKVKLPPNFHILGTVNTSDQNVNVLDTAFKRRFDFVYVGVEPVLKPQPNAQGNQVYFNDYQFSLGGKSFNWIKFYMSLNEFIVDKLNLPEDKQLGQFFIQFTSDDTQNFEFIKNKLLNYLWDDVESASFAETSLFFVGDDNNSKINSFSKLYKKFLDTTPAEEIFSEEFLECYDNYSLN